MGTNCRNIKTLVLALPLLGSAFLVACGDEAVNKNETGDTAAVPADYDDADNDTIMDIHEGDMDTDSDNDGTPNYLDTDSDNDGIPDSIEAGDDDVYTYPVDSDGDSIPDFLDTDSDNNGVPDEVEAGDNPEQPADTDNDGIYDFQDTDNDGDGIGDIIEIGDNADTPRDSDGDSTPDYLDMDSDGDGIGDIYEAGTTDWEDEPLDSDGDGKPDYLDTDSDNDGILDSVESGVDDTATEPVDTDGDGMYDFQDPDSDGDSLTDDDELNIYHTDPYDPDSDGDMQSDGAEVAAGTDPNDPLSLIDGIYVEVPERTDTEQLFQFEISIQMGDIAFLIDTTGSMSGTANAMANEFSNIVSEIDAILDDAAYGYATFDDYNCCGYGSGPDKPFELHQQITTDTSMVQEALSSTNIHSGDDGPESSTEALYQGITGEGYDMNCDALFSSEDDVQPFIASSSDPFGGTGGETYDPSTPDAGDIGGFGFREYALPILIYATDNYMRDPDEGFGTPGGCWQDASSDDVVDALDDIDGYLIGVSCSGSTPVPQMETLAAETGSIGDADGDGEADDLLVFTWTGSDEDFRTLITEAVENLVNAITFDWVELEVVGDSYGFVIDISPDRYTDIDPSDDGATLDFTLTFRGVVAATTEDQLFVLTLNVLGDGVTLLATYDILVLVPGTDV